MNILDICLILMEFVAFVYSKNGFKNFRRYNGTETIKGELLQNTSTKSVLHCTWLCNEYKPVEGDACNAVRYSETTNACQLLVPANTSTQQWSTNDSQWSIYEPSCPIGWVKNRNSCYLEAVDHGLPWREANHYCETKGGTLTAITDDAENEFVGSLYSGWLGGSDLEVEGEWKWTTGEVWNFTSWYPGFPQNYTDNDCLIMFGHLWRDFRCSRAYPFICEKGV
ncbi:PGCA-like protein [Mya arenaria]|uniref:PGCA-like protein n=1 Tax=Mya arenaria TaxID=6604 RepID=A0ABY7FV25_MYAAR|nr:PGCA-like protein [Mya arenaria]